MSDERLKIAVFIDFDNIEIGVKSTLGTSFDVGAVLEAIKERGEVVSKVAYGDWTRATDYGRAMSQHAVHMVQRNLTPGGDKNGADINLALDALEMAFTHNHINAFVIVGGDSDFITLVEKLKQYDRKVFVVGGRAFTSQVMQKNCTEFIAYEDVVGLSGRGARQPGRSGRGTGEMPLSSAMPLLRRALKLLADREVLPQLGLLKSTLLQLDSSFSERAYGASSFRDFVQKLANAGYVTLKGTDRSFHVELRERDEPGAAPATVAAPPARAAGQPPAVSRNGEPAQAEGATQGEDAATPAPIESGEAAGMPEEAGPRPGPVDGFRVIQAAFARPGALPRFPMYVRQVKQFVRQYDETFDERKYGFAGLVDALRYGQREGLFRLERDRQGVVRVYPGTKYPRPVAPSDLMESTGGSADAEAGTDGRAIPVVPVPDGDERQRHEAERDGRTSADTSIAEDAAGPGPESVSPLPPPVVTPSPGPPDEPVVSETASAVAGTVDDEPGDAGPVVDTQASRDLPVRRGRKVAKTTVAGGAARRTSRERSRPASAAPPEATSTPARRKVAKPAATRSRKRTPRADTTS